MHFENINKDDPINVSTEYNLLNEAYNIIDDTCNLTKLNSPFNEDEITICVKKLKNNKAYGPDHIINEYIKSTIEQMMPIYINLFNLVLESGLIPSDWLIGIIIPIYKKKGNCEDPKNYRGITILSCFGKLFTSLINNRLTCFVEELYLIGSEQACFRKSFSTLDDIVALQSIIDI